MSNERDNPRRSIRNGRIEAKGMDVLTSIPDLSLDSLSVYVD